MQKVAAVQGTRLPPCFDSGTLHIQNGRIAQISGAPAGDVPAGDVPALDASGLTLLPGFIDLHIHGAAGHDTMDATPAALAAIAREVARHGVTAFVPTTITASVAETRRAVENVAAYMRDQANHPSDGARVLGVHLEGPFISPKHPGAQPAQHIRLPDLAEFQALVDTGCVRLITLAPEQPGADELIRSARRQGIGVILGHTDATFVQCQHAVDLGASQATHTFNAMRGFHHREPGTAGATLALDGLCAQLIADNVHVHPAAVRVLARCKGVDGTLLITDAMRAAGLPDGEYDLGGQTVRVEGGECRLPDGTLAGSVLTMERALQNFLAASGWSLAEAWPVSSRSAALSLGMDSEMGLLEAGRRADLVLLDQGLAVVATLVGGEVAYLRKGEEDRLTLPRTSTSPCCIPSSSDSSGSAEKDSA